MIKKLTILCAALSVNTVVFAQGALVRGAAALPKARVTQLERSLTQQCLPFSRTIFHRQGPLSARYAGLLTRITLMETAPGKPIAIEHIKQLPDPESFRKVDFSYTPSEPELQLLQDYVKEHHRWPVVGTDPEVLFAFISLVQKDVRGLLKPTDRQQLYMLFFQSLCDKVCTGLPLHVYYMENLTDELKAWRSDQRHVGNDPKLVPQDQLKFPFYFEIYAREWNLAARIYLAQRIYGDALPKILQEVNIIPEPKILPHATK